MLAESDDGFPAHGQSALRPMTDVRGGIGTRERTMGGKAPQRSKEMVEIESGIDDGLASIEVP